MLANRVFPFVCEWLPAAGTDRVWTVEITLGGSRLDPERLLAESEGFLVDDARGREIGVVDEIEVDGAGRVAALLVAGGWFGRWRSRVPVDAIDSLLPRERRVVVRDGWSPRSRLGRRSR
jgi:hypothetical protein